MDPQTAPTEAGSPPAKQERPEVPQHIQSKIKEWWTQTDNLVQRANALWQFREANKTLFPARFNINDPRRGQTPMELQSGKDKRRVQTPYIFRDGLQTTAMAIPDDLSFTWPAIEQVKPPQDPNLAIAPTMAMASGAMPPPSAAISPPVSQNIDPQIQRFGDTIRIVEKNLLEEVNWLQRVQAMVQDGGYYPASILKFAFRRDYKTASLRETPSSKDETDSIARLQALVQRYALKEFDDKSPQYSDMLALVASLKNKAALTRWFGIDLQLIQLDAFGICEDCLDAVDIYETPWMYHDAIKTGEELLSQYPFVEREDGTTEGILPDELTNAVPWDQRSASADPNSRNRVSRNRQLTTPRATPSNTASSQGKDVDPKKLKYHVREIWCKKDRTVYTVVRGIQHYVRVEIPQRTCARWYPFIIHAPSRVPGEVYGCSDLEMKADIQARIHRKRTDEEKARWLHIRRYVYNKQLVDEKEIQKAQDIPPGQFRGIALPSNVKMDDVIMPLEQPFDPVSFDTSKDERDKDQMGALPVQALGTTGVANFATEANLAAQGASIATQFRQAQIRRDIEIMLTGIAEILLQELTVDEVRQIAGPFAVWPAIYDDNEAEQVVNDAKQRAAQNIMPAVIPQLVSLAQAGMPITEKEIQAQVETLSAPLWQQELIERFGATEPMTREALFRRLKVKVKSSLTSSLDKQNRIQGLAMLAEATMQLAQAAQGAMIPFNPRPFLQIGAKLVGEEEALDEIFPAVNPTQMAAQQIAQQVAAAQPAAPGAKNPNNQGGAIQAPAESKPQAALTPAPG